MAPLTVSVPILGALTTGGSFSIVQLLYLGLVGLCAHLFGFALNDLIDHPLDRTIAARQHHPLVTRTLAAWEAWAFTLIQVPLALGVYAFLLHGGSLGLGLLGLSILLSVVYNVWSKWGRLPRILPELALAGSIGVLTLTGALTNSPTLPSLTLLYAFAMTLLLLLVNSVPSGLKDLKTDAAYGAKSFVLSTGTRMVDTDQMCVSKALWIYSFAIQLLLMLCSALLIPMSPPHWVIVLLVVILHSYAALHLRMILALDSFRALRRSMPLLSGYYNYAAVALLLIGWMPVGLQLFYEVCTLMVLLVPLRLGYGVWRRRYGVVSVGLVESQLQ